MQHPAQLQINQHGAWRGVLDFDVGEVTPAFLQSVDDLGRLCGARLAMRIVGCVPSPSGRALPTRTAILTWSREKSWVKT